MKKVETIKIRIGASLVSISANSYWNKPSRDQHDINSILRVLYRQNKINKGIIFYIRNFSIGKKERKMKKKKENQRDKRTTWYYHTESVSSWRTQFVAPAAVEKKFLEKFLGICTRIPAAKLWKQSNQKSSNIHGNRYNWQNMRIRYAILQRCIMQERKRNISPRLC